MGVAEAAALALGNMGVAEAAVLALGNMGVIAMYFWKIMMIKLGRGRLMGEWEGRSFVFWG